MRQSLLFAMLLAAACGRGGRGAQPPPGQAARECPCPCPASGAPGAASPGALPPDAQGLLASAARKMNHGDGPGCLQDLDQLLAMDARHTESQVVLRGQCEMLSGRCQDGKKRIDAWASYQLAMAPEQRLSLVEGMTSLYCRGGDMTDRDRLLAAHHQLVQGAHLRQMSAADCNSAYQTVRSLAPRVPPRGPDDTLVSSMPKALFHTAANCFARAGDCAAARRAFDESYPQDSLANVHDPKLRQKILDDGFKSSVPRCAP